MEYSSNDVKQLFRSVYTLVKGQDEQKATLTVDAILQPSFQLSHRVLVAQCVQLIFEDFECVGQKSREILWRKGYYDVIGLLKRQKGRANGAALLQAADRLICEGINYFKAIVLRFAQIFNLDSLRYLVDFALLEDYDMVALREEPSCYALLQLQTQDDEAGTVKKELYTKQEISYALETIHALLIALGDLHRYQLEFGIGSRVEVRERARAYYLEAFKLNPKVGMAQNQLGMLVAGQNGNLDAVYHYLYSLCCAVPFECSETNVNVIFQKNIRHLESGGDLVNGGGGGGGVLVDGNDQLVDEFIATFLLVVDVFFYDKDVTDFTALCHSVLLEFKKILSIRQLLDEYYLTDDMLFKIVSILFFCMHRIKLINSDKIYSLNAFLVALCSELLQWCTSSFEKFTNEHSREDARFQEMYLRRYQRYDEQVHRARDMIRNGSAMFSKDQKSSSGVEEGTGSQDSRGNKENEMANHGGKGAASSLIVGRAKRGGGSDNGSSRGSDSRQKKHSRRRRRAYSNETDSEDGERYEDGDGSEDDYYNHGSDTDSSNSSEEEQEEEEEEEEEEDDMISLSSYGSYDEYSGEEEDDRDRSEEEGNQPGNQRNETDGQQQSGATDDMPAAEQLKFKKRYQKLDPNIVLEFAQGERTMRSLKLLLDWLLCNMDVLHNCYQSNPEFLHNIMKLLNWFNLDFFTNRFYFARDMITVPGLRADLQEIFNVRRIIPLQEDVAMKRFPLFEAVQEGLQWETPYRLAISREDESFLRLMKMVDVGFVVCKSKKFDYCFQPKVRAFRVRAGLVGAGSNKGRTNNNNKMATKGQRNGGKPKRKDDALGGGRGGNKRDWNGDGGDGVNRSRGLSYNQSRSGRTTMGANGGLKAKRIPAEHHQRRAAAVRDRIGDGEDADMLLLARGDAKRQRNRMRQKGARNGVEDYGQDGHESAAAPTLFTKKGYLHNRSNGMLMPLGSTAQNGAVDEAAVDEMQRDKRGGGGPQEKGDISAIMGQLWLRNEVETLESKVNKRAGNVVLTPYLVLDSKCLSEYTSIVKNLIKSKKFVVLIPNAVLGDLDELKKHSEGARNAIKWLEVEFSKGNRFLRAQKAHETLPMPLVKIPKKLDREGAVFNHIVQFCNHIVTNHADSEGNDIITYLSGDNLQEKKLCNGSSFTGILEAIPVKFEQIVTFYSSYKRK
ncbi:nonsense-mediated mRNA decay factor SMG5 [Anopheles gambiae]|uniref:nonsense-mediated mRNA decay factor SMG5 n=1 Tax=Anopheles coluzzii TaxID=1518534 RepID=UPI0020FF84AD|nr:nonsense-mediated mRNA decay factor SMG5 [Anopheles coluzzii]XP_061510227.1 nonsense-mediated mRNA decay factor SMG5 [Anopheles gambiae]